MVSASWHAGTAKPCGSILATAIFGDRFRKIIEAIKTLPVRSCFVDGEVIAVDERGLSVFDLIRSGRRDRDLIELDGRDMRTEPIEERKHALANL
jgi:bifunctional non-homologous end joining protein LigD